LSGSGVGSSCIFPLLGAKLNRWSFYASDVDPVVLQQAADNVTRNALDERIHLVQANILRDVLKVSQGILAVHPTTHYLPLLANHGSYY